MNNRLLSFIKAENLTQSQFADSIGVARASISHILSGRNKPGFDFIENIARKYPNLSLEWLITGKGKMYVSQRSEPHFYDNDNLFPDSADSAEICNPHPEQNIPAEKVIAPETKAVEKSEEKPVSHSDEIRQTLPDTDKKPIDQIIIFYSDGTYNKVY